MAGIRRQRRQRPTPSDPMIPKRTAITAQLAILTLLGLSLASAASARTTGIVGYSGRSNGLFCGNAGFGCHAMSSGTTPPQVRIEGPAQVDPESETPYRFVVTSGSPDVQIQAGFNVAASAGDLVVVSGQQAKLSTAVGNPRPELTHTGPKDIDENGEASWEFIWRAPTTPGEYVLFGAGNSVDASTTVDGDAAALTMLVVAVGDIAPTPTPTATPLPCAGDCDGNGRVSIAELIAGVSIALRTASVDICRACDTSGDGTVSIGEIIAAVNKALNGC
jgi:hypothetical protein